LEEGEWEFEGVSMVVVLEGEGLADEMVLPVGEGVAVVLLGEFAGEGGGLGGRRGLADRPGFCAEGEVLWGGAED
jgi:hypothetical protein